MRLNLKIWAFIKNISLGDVLAFCGLIISFIALLNASSDVSILIFAIYIVLLAILLVEREFDYSRKARYAEAMSALHKCSHRFRDAFHEIIQGQDKERVRKEIRELLIPFANAFTLITSTRCRACIKIINVKKSQKDKRDNIETKKRKYYAETFARSDTPDLSLDKDKEADIEKNTDFSKIFFRQENYYMCNNLINQNPYLNSNWPSDPDERKKFIEREEYDYISAVVWPIQSKPATPFDKPVVIAFLCVDSLSRNVFTRRYDIDTGAIIADSLYPILKVFREKFLNIPKLERM